MSKIKIEVCSLCREEECNGIIYTIKNKDDFPTHMRERRVCEGSCESPDYLISLEGEIYWQFFKGHGDAMLIPLEKEAK